MGLVNVDGEADQSSRVPSIEDLKKQKHEMKKETQSTPVVVDRGFQNLQPIEEKMPEEKKIEVAHLDYATDTQVETHVFGVGGCGKVAAIRYSKAGKLNKKITTIDTSGVTDDIPGVESIRIDGLNGSGKLRRYNAEQITNFVVDYTSKTVFAPVNVIIFSFSGGSGSVIGPLLVAEILRQKKTAIVIGVIDTDSEIDTINAFNCLTSVDMITDKQKGYLPIVLFDNNFGRLVVDRGVDKIMSNLSCILDTPYIGLDTQDRIKFFNPKVFDGVSGGIRMLNVTKRDDGLWEDNIGLVTPDETHEKLDAAILISEADNHLTLTNRCVATFRGYYIKNGENVVAEIGYQLPERFIKELNANVHSFRSIVSKKKTVIESEHNIGEKSDNGLIL